MTLILAGTAGILVCVLGIVTWLSRQQETQRRLLTAQDYRNQIAERITALWQEVEHTDAYTTGEARRLAEKIRVETSRLNTAFAEASRKLDQLASRRGIGDIEGRTIASARILESFDSVKKQVEQAQWDVDELNAMMQKAKEQTEPWTTAWQNTKSEIAKTVREPVPETWRAQWDTIDRLILQCTVLTDPLRREQELMTVQAKIDLWRDRASVLKTYIEWQTAGASRLSTVAGCLKRLEGLGGEDTALYGQLKQACEDVRKLMNLSLEEATEGASDLCRKLEAPFTERITRASRLLAMFASRGSALESRVRVRDELSAICTWWDSAAAQEMLETASVNESQEYRDFESSISTNVEAAKRVMDPLDLPPDTPRAMLEQADEALSLISVLTEQKRALQMKHETWVQDKSAIHQRLKSLERNIADVLERLIRGKLVTTDAYQRLTAFRDEVYELEDRGQFSQDDVEKLEGRVQDAIRLADAALSTRDSLDASLQEHLDQVVHHRRGRPMLDTWQEERGYARDHLDNGDLAAAAWTTFALAEAMFTMDEWTDWDDWSS